MEAFSLLKYWRTNPLPDGGAAAAGGGGGARGKSADTLLASKPEPATTILTAVAQDAVDIDDEEDGDDGPFFDLEFTVPDDEDDDDEEDPDSEDEGEGKHAEEGKEEEQSTAKNDEDDDDGVEESDCERELNFTLSSASSNDRTDPNISLSPSDDLFFKGKLVPLEPSEPNFKPPHLRVSLLKSATKFRVFMSGLKRSSKSNAAPTTTATATAAAEKTAEPNPAAAAATKQKPEAPHAEKEKESKQSNQSKFFTVKFKVEDAPIVSLFTRDTSSKNVNRSQKQNADESAASADEKRFSKEVMQKYLKKMKPLYVRVSRRYGEKLRLSGQLSLGSGAKAVAAPPPPPPPASAAVKSQNEGDAEAATVTETKTQKQGNFPGRLRVVCKQLGKSRSASSVVAAAPPPPPAQPSRRRDDSLLQQQDGIQSAILHCKRSFNSSRDCAAESGTMLGRCVSDPSHEVSRKSSDKGDDDDDGL